MSDVGSIEACRGDRHSKWLPTRHGRATDVGGSFISCVFNTAVKSKGSFMMIMM